MLNINEFCQGLQKTLKAQVQIPPHDKMSGNDLMSLFYEDWDALPKEVREFFTRAIGSHLQPQLQRIREQAVQAHEATKAGGDA